MGLGFLETDGSKREYCGFDLARINPKSWKLGVCNGRDYYSNISYKTLIERNSHLPFFAELKEYCPEFTDQQIGSVIRWLYRGMKLYDAVEKVESDRRWSSRCKKGQFFKNLHKNRKRK